MTQSDKINEICQEFLRGLKSILDDKLQALYIFGAAAFPDKLHVGDIDFHVILKHPLSEDERTALYELHDTITQKFPPLGGELDGYYILQSTAQLNSPPKSEMWDGVVDHSWALHCAHIRSGRCIVYYGSDPKAIYPEPTWNEIEDALQAELKYVEDHLEKYPDYCILNLCRLIYSYTTREVVISKADSAIWASNEFPEWDKLVNLAIKSYSRLATTEDRNEMLLKVGEFYKYTIKCIEKEYD